MNQSSEKNNIRAVALISSGLDSLLSARIVADQGIEVLGIYFLFRYDVLDVEGKEKELGRLFQEAGIPFIMDDITEDFMTVLRQPEHGYGSGVNPCIDCHLFMLKRAAKWMDRGYDFLITGEVVGQRPMSQTKPTLFHIDRVSGLRGWILRPLSARHLPVTVPEERKWIDREKLYGFSGRSRKEQIALARKMGITGYPQPAGGCVLTEPGFSKRAKVFMENKGSQALTPDNLKLFRFGRHLWPRKDLHVIVGRDENDNRLLEQFIKGRWVFRMADTHKSPLVLAEGISMEGDIDLIARITARYGKPSPSGKSRVHYEGENDKGEITVVPVDESQLTFWRL